jgi:DNA-binding transcriptional regulator LsrR (DeoR family)
MNQTDLEIFEMYFMDGMKEAEIAESLGLSVEAINEVLAAMEAEGASGDAAIELQAEAEWRYEQTLDR